MFSFSLVNLSFFSLTLCVFLALCLDKLVGEAERFHPLVGFGYIAKRIEKRLNKGRLLKLKGSAALGLCLSPCICLAYLISTWLNDDMYAEIIFSSFVLYVCIGWRSLLEHGKAVYLPLEKQKINEAQDAVSRIVSRDCDDLDETDIAVAATESILENGADAIFAAIFWFLLAGVPGVVCYRLANTLDAMWGYKNSRFTQFGWAAARFDDALNYFPARLTAFSYALCGHTKSAFKCWLTQARYWKSPNAGPVMSSGAGAILVSLGGKAVYHGTTHLRPLLGLTLTATTRANSSSIKAACQLVSRSLYLWLLTMVVVLILSDVSATSSWFEELVEYASSWLK